MPHTIPQSPRSTTRSPPAPLSRRSANPVPRTKGASNAPAPSSRCPAPNTGTSAPNPRTHGTRPRTTNRPSAAKSSKRKCRLPRLPTTQSSSPRDSENESRRTHTTTTQPRARIRFRAPACTACTLATGTLRTIPPERSTPPRTPQISRCVRHAKLDVRSKTHARPGARSSTR